MLCLAGYPLGLTFTVLDPAAAPPAGDLAPTVRANYDDPAGLDRLAAACDVVTYEFEQIPADSVRKILKQTPVFPSERPLEVAQDRLKEKNCFRSLGISTPEFEPVADLATLLTAVDRIGYPAVLKTRSGGYDGKGQALIRSLDDCSKAIGDVGEGELILEGYVDFDRELSVIAARSRTGETAVYPLTENQHGGGILRVSRAPASVTVALREQADALVRSVLEHFDYVGVLAIELFEKDGTLYGNELAPRVHNSGHWTIEGAATSQFENHIRAVAGLPLGDAAGFGNAAMVNFVGTMPEAADVLATGAHLHVYGKDPRPGRKLGHATLTDQDVARLGERLATLTRLAGTPSGG